MSNKTQLSLENMQTFLRERFSKTAEMPKPLVEGEESQAFWFTDQNKEYVLRINRSDYGFKKDAYAYQNFCSAQLPIPKVFLIENFDENHCFCISEKLGGITLQDLDEKTLAQIVGSVDTILSAINETDISSTSGFGVFDETGKGRFSSWEEYCISILDENHGMISLKTPPNQELIKKLTDVFRSLLPHLPQERKLVHGDFGSNNVLTDGRAITGVIDWDSASCGDPLFDVAGAYFWSPWLKCMEKQAEFWERKLSTLPQYRERINFYQIRLALAEIYDNARDGDADMLEWLQRRAANILSSLG